MSNKNAKRIRGKYVGGRSRWYYLFRGVFCSIIITVPCIVILSLIMMFSDFTEEYMSTPILVSVPLCVVFSSFLSTLGSKNSGWINGTLTALIYAGLVFIVRSVLLGGIYIDVSTLLLFGGFSLIGSIGGIAGILVTQMMAKR